MKKETISESDKKEWIFKIAAWTIIGFSIIGIYFSVSKSLSLSLSLYSNYESSDKRQIRYIKEEIVDMVRYFPSEQRWEMCWRIAWTSYNDCKKYQGSYTP